MGRLLEGNDVLMEDGPCVTHGELIKAFKASNIGSTYQFRGGDIRETMDMEFTGRLGREGVLKFLGGISVYLRPIGRQLRSEFNGSSRCGDADTYDHTRRIPREGNRNGKGGNGRVWHFREAVGIIEGG